jgi:carboxylesterase
MQVPGSGDKSPIFLPGSGPAVLCLHGFSGTPYETAPLAHFLAAAGFFVSSPLLAGHGETVDVLGKTRWQDWLASSEAAFERLRAESGQPTIAIAGFSMGGLLALRLARRHPRRAVSALALMAPPLRLPRREEILMRAWRLLPAIVNRSRFAVVKKRGGSDVSDSAIRSENPALAEMPLAGVVELMELARVVRDDLGTIFTPTLLVHGERDRTVPLESSFELAGRLASSVVERLQLPRSGHLVGVDIERATFCAKVKDFFTRQLQARADERIP